MRPKSLNFIDFQFGKEIQANQVPGWSSYYLDYKSLKKIISSLAANRPASAAAALALGVRQRPADVLDQSTSASIGSTPIVQISGDDTNQPPIEPSSTQDDSRGADFQAHKAAFFFKLERELEKV